MITIFEIPDEAADRAAGKRTALVRLGRRRATGLVAAAIFGAYAALIALPALGAPPEAAMAALTFPLALTMVWLLRRQVHTGSARYGWLTFCAIGLFGLTAALEALGLFLAASTP